MPTVPTKQPAHLEAWIDLVVEAVVRELRQEIDKEKPEGLAGHYSGLGVANADNSPPDHHAP
jgi:hypothetical protein